MHITAPDYNKERKCKGTNVVSSTGKTDQTQLQINPFVKSREVGDMI